MTVYGLRIKISSSRLLFHVDIKTSFTSGRPKLLLSSLESNNHVLNIPAAISNGTLRQSVLPKVEELARLLELSNLQLPSCKFASRYT